MSRLETMRTDLTTELAVITTAGGYRTNVPSTKIFTTLKDESSIILDASIHEAAVSVLAGDEDINAIDTSRQSWDSFMDVLILGICWKDDEEGLLHDLKRVAGAVSLKYANANNDRWFVVKQKPLFRVTRDLIPLTRFVYPSVLMSTRILAQTGAF